MNKAEKERQEIASVWPAMWKRINWTGRKAWYAKINGAEVVVRRCENAGDPSSVFHAEVNWIVNWKGRRVQSYGPTASEVLIDARRMYENTSATEPAP
jgi:hypothetical protein